MRRYYIRPSEERDREVGERREIGGWERESDKGAREKVYRKVQILLYFGEKSASWSQTTTEMHV